MNLQNVFNRVKSEAKLRDTQNFRNTFVEDNRGLSAEEFGKMMDKKVNILNHFNEYKNWYLPFDVCTWMMIIDDKPLHWKAVTIEDNPEHLLGSNRRFVAMDSNAKFDGIFKIVTIDEPEIDIKDYALFDKPIFTETENEKPKYKILAYFYSVTYEDGTRIHINDYLHSEDALDMDMMSAAKDTMNTMMGLIKAVTYFTDLMIDTKLFILEESIATKRKGKLKIKMNQKLYHVIDARTIRKKYVTSNPSGTGTKIEVGYPRRRFVRTYRDDCYVNMKGQTQIIESTWCGPSESFEPSNDRLYKVRLDIG